MVTAGYPATPPGDVSGSVNQPPSDPGIDRLEAVRRLRRAVEREPDSAEAHVRLGTALQEANDLEGAVAAFRAAAERDENFWQGHFRAGVALKGLGRLAEATEALERAARIVPDDFIVRNVLVTTLSGLGRREEAVREGQRALELKDRAAQEFFRRSGFEGLRLTRVSKPFAAGHPKRNVIAFSLWGDGPVYTEGAIINAEISRYIYGDWTCRFYCDNSVPKSVTQRLAALGAQVVTVDDELKKVPGGLWRFFASDDPAVDRFLCRDCDSRLNTQERVAVDEWIESGKLFHVMRDHVYHMELILAGMWGGVASALPNLRELATKHWLFNRNRWSDQYFLWGIVWPLVRDDVFSHDSHYRLGPSVDFPKYGRLPRHQHVGGAAQDLGERARAPAPLAPVAE